MGGQVWRASEPAYYGDKIGPRTLDDKLSAAGTFSLTKTAPGSGAFFGFFRAEQPGAGGRPICSLGLDLDCEHSGARLAVRLITGQNQSCGTFITPFIPGKFRPTSIKNDGTRYRWKLDYDPQAVGGRGRFTFTIHGDAESFEGHADLPQAHKDEARTRFPSTTTFAVDLPDGYKQQCTTFDHFGLMNMMKPGGRMSIYFDDLEYEGRSQDFSQEPHWDASGNRANYRAKDVGGAHSFGFITTNHAGGKPGEIGGTFWRTDNWGYYADRVGPLSFNDRLEARGRIVMVAGGPDSDMCCLDAPHHRADSASVPILQGDIMPVRTTYTNARANLASLLKRVTQDQEIVIIDRRGGGDVAMIAADELSSLMETAHLLRSPKNAERLLNALNRARSKKLKPRSVESLRQELGLGERE